MSRRTLRPLLFFGGFAAVFIALIVGNWLAMPDGGFLWVVGIVAAALAIDEIDFRLRRRKAPRGFPIEPSRHGSVSTMAGRTRDGA